VKILPAVRSTAARDLAASHFHFPIGYSADPGRITSFTGSHPGFVRDLAGDQLTSVQAFFDDTENVYAGYGQYDITLFNRLNILVGLRAEVTNAVYGANANPPGNGSEPRQFIFVCKPAIKLHRHFPDRAG
jgi:hypothetical protein